MATKTPSKTPDVAAKITKYREMAKDKSLPQDVRNGYLDKANELEYSTYKPTMAKGGAVMDKKAMKMNYGGMAMKEPMMDMRQSTKQMPKQPSQSSSKVSDLAQQQASASAVPAMAKGGAVVAKAPKSPMKSMSKSPAVVIAVGMAKKPTKMNKGGMANCGASVAPAQKGK